MDADLEQILTRFAKSELSGPVALMELLIATESVLQVQLLLEQEAGTGPLRELLSENLAGCHRIVSMLGAGNDSPEPASSVEAGIAFCRRLFDASVQESAACSVALYSLDNPALLDRATAEVVDLLMTRGLLSPEVDVLDIGCGTGRFERALSSRVRSVLGIDVSAQMVRVAQEACAALFNVRIQSCSGLDLQPLPDGCMDLVLAVDSFPYLHQSGPQLVSAHVHEAARVLRGGGHLAIFNLSYNRERGEDTRELDALGAQAHLDQLVSGVQPLPLWNARFFLLRKPSH